MKFKVLKNFYGKLRIRIEDTIDFICPVAYDSVQADVVIRYIPDLELIELISFKTFLDSIESGTLESVCNDITMAIRDVVKPMYVSVSVRGKTEKHSLTTVKKAYRKISEGVRKYHYEEI